MIRYYKCCKSREMSDQQYIMIGNVTLGYNLVVETQIPTKKLSVLSFQTQEGCVNCLILVGAFFQ